MPEPTVAVRRALVAVNEDPAAHRRTRELAAALRRLGFAVTIASPAPSGAVASLDFPQRRIGGGSLSRLLGPAFGPLSRNLARLSITLLTFLPHASALWALRRTTRFLLRLDDLEAALNERPDVVFVEDVLLLPAVLAWNGGSRVIFDAREFFPLQFEHSRLWRLLVGSGMRRFMVLALPACDAVMTVSEGLRDGFRTLCDVDPLVVLNVPSRTELPSGLDRERSSDNGLTRVVFHGRANANRGLEALSAAAALLEGRATFDLYLTGPRRHRQRVERAAEGLANFTVHDPVPFADVPAALADFDVGIAFFAPRTFNLRHAMPSKLFEYLHAGLPVVIGPSPDMGDVLRRFDCGIVAEDFTPAALAAAIASVDQQRLDQLRQNARAAAAELCAEVEYGKLAELVDRSSPLDGSGAT